MRCGCRGSHSHGRCLHDGCWHRRYRGWRDGDNRGWRYVGLHGRCYGCWRCGNWHCRCRFGRCKVAGTCRPFYGDWLHLGCRTVHCGETVQGLLLVMRSPVRTLVIAVTPLSPFRALAARCTFAAITVT